MALEIEAKMKIDSPAAIIERLEMAGAAAQGTHFETNTFFDTNDRRLLAADQGLRLRVAVDTHTGSTHCILTHKGPGQHSQLKSREETELQVANPHDAQRLLLRLGYRPMISFEKRRKTWRLEPCLVELDEIPILGHFVEIEGPDEASVMAVRDRLALSDRPLIKAGYIAMLSSHLQEQGDRRTEIRFE